MVQRELISTIIEMRQLAISLDNAANNGSKINFGEGKLAVLCDPEELKRASQYVNEWVESLFALLPDQEIELVVSDEKTSSE